MKTKRIFIFALIFSFLFIFINSSFAWTETDITENVILSARECANGSNFTIFADSTVLYLITYDSSCRLYTNGNYLCSTKDMLLHKFNGNKFISTSTSHTIFDKLDTFRFFVSTTNIYTSQTGDEVFFYITPQYLIQSKAIILEEMETKTMFQEILSIIPPILVVVAFLIGFSKAFNLLLMLLRRA